MTHVTCRLTAKNWDQLQNPTLGNRVWATFTFLLGDRGCITKQSSVCFPVSIGRLEQNCLQLVTKSSGQLQQFKLCRQPVPCSWCSDRDSPVTDSSTGRRHNEVTWRRSRQCISRTDVSTSEMHSMCPRSDFWTIKHNSCVCLSVGHIGKPCNNWSVDLGEHKEPCIRRRPKPGKGNDRETSAGKLKSIVTMWCESCKNH